MIPLPVIIQGAKVIKKVATVATARKAVAGKVTAETGSALSSLDTARGIQNVTSRFKKQRAGQLLQSEFLGGEGQKETARSSGRQARRRGSSRRGISPRERFQEDDLLRREFEEIARTSDIGYERGDENLLLKDPPKKPAFPGFILGIALIKDVLDSLEVTVIGVIITTALSFLIALVLFFWTLGRLNGGWWKKKLIKKIFIKYGISIAVEFIPGLKLVPTTTIFVLMAHYDETKLVRLLNGALERMRSGGIRGG